MVSPNRRSIPFRFRFAAATSTAIGLLCCVVLFVAVGCGESQETPETPEPTTNPDLNVSFGALPTGYQVQSNDSESMRLRPTDPESQGEMWVEVDDRSDFGIAVTEIVAAQREIFEGLPEGSFGGNQQLQTPAGRAYYSRGRYQHEGAAVEETRVFLVHPSENRLVTFHYRYPAGDDSADRVQTLFQWVGELSAAGNPQPEPTPAETPSD